MVVKGRSKQATSLLGGSMGICLEEKVMRERHCRKRKKQRQTVDSAGNTVPFLRLTMSKHTADSGMSWTAMMGSS